MWGWALLRENSQCPPLPFSAVKWQLQTEITCPPKWSWRAWFNEGKKLVISVGLNLPLIFGLNAFISQQLLYLLPHSFLPKAQWGTKRGSAGRQRCTWRELHLFHFVLLCTIWSFWSVIYPQGLTALCSTTHDGRGCGLWEPWCTTLSRFLCLCALKESRPRHLPWLPEEKNGCIHGRWDYSNWLNLQPAQNDIIILILFLPSVWHLLWAKNMQAVFNHSNLRNDFGETTSKNHSQNTEQDRVKCCLSAVWEKSN